VNAVSTNTSTAENGGAFAAGGLLGMALSAEISESWASGKVSAWRTTNGRIFAGGLVGSLGAYHTQEAEHDHLRSSISNCYALGDVSADNSAGGNATQVYAGGLAGHVYIDSVHKIEYSFAAGSVTARSAGTGATVYAGGVMGYKRTADGALSNTAALGEGTTIPTIFAAGGGTLSANRVYGASAGGTCTNNYALGSMRTGTDPSYYAVVAGSIPTGDLGANAKNGASTAAAVFRTQNFWTSTLGFNTNTWSFTYLAGKGYPLLKNAGGQ
jgi:hypothetical protein